MSNFPFIKWFRNVSIAKKLFSVVGIMAVLIAVELGTLYFAVDTLSSVRAFVGAEGLWSKSQKDAVYYLQQYSQSHNEDDEQAFYHFMKVPLGYHKTLMELRKANVDLNVARQGLLEGGSHPNDIDGMIQLFRRFENNSYIHKSTNIWAEADSTVARLIPIAKKLHAEINLPIGQAGSPSPSQNKLDAIIRQIEPINQKLTILENDFSYTLGEGARWLENIILKILLAIAVTVELSGLILTYFVVRGISKGLKEIINASESVAKRDFSARAKVFSNDEIGVLANSFNEMTIKLSNSIQKQIRSSQDLESKTKFIQENERRIAGIMDALIKTTQLDFSEKLIVSDSRDELDAIAVGLNTMSEELEFYLQQLKQSEEKLNDAQRLAKIGSWEMDMETNKVHWSNEMFNLYGYGNERFEVTFEKALERMLPEDAERTKARTKKQVEDAIQSFHEKNTLEFQNDPITYMLDLPDGGRKVVQGIGKIILNTSGKVTKMVGTVQDITEQDKAEKKLNQYNIELEVKNKELESFTYITSHDLQEPLRKIQLFAQRILDSEYQRLSDKGKVDFKRMQNAATKMRFLIKDLLAYSHATTSQDDREYINLNDIVEDVKLEFSETIAEKDAIIEVRELGELQTFHFQIRQLVHNLIGNSLKFSRLGHPPHIRIESEFKRGKDLHNENLISETNYCHLKFEDNGIGFKKEYREKIFDVFQRLHGSDDYPGSGIGLAIVKKIVENHNGVITASSSVDQGAIFDIYIPVD